MSIDLENNTILLLRHGSHAYGLNTENSDIDYRAIFIAPKKYYFGMDKLEHFKTTDNIDGIIVEKEGFEIRKFLYLAKNCNPNILELLYIDDENLIKTTKYGDLIRENRSKFLNKKIRYSFGGMAKHHLNRIREHRDYILNPPKPPPTRKEFGLPEYEEGDKRKMSQCLAEIDKEITSWNIDYGPMLEYEKIKIQDQLKSLTTKYVDSKLRTAGRLLNFNDELIDVLEKERAFRNLKTKYKQYLDWKATRNPKRFVLEEKIGYDPKDGSHLLRIIRQAIEALIYNTLNVKRTIDREELLYIKQGNMKFEDLMEIVDKEMKRLNQVVEISTISNEPDHAFIDNLCLEITEEFFKKNYKSIKFFGDLFRGFKKELPIF